MTDANGKITNYGWGSCPTPPTPSCTQMNTITDPRNVVVLTNAYDGSARVRTQVLGDATSTYTFTYGTDPNGNAQTTITDPRGFDRQITFNGDGYVTKDIRALNRPEQQTLTYDRQAGSGLLNSTTDALGRTTSFQYDVKGKVTSVTRLAGTAQAVTTSFTYDPQFNELATITDPLNHITTLAYDSKGNLTSVKDGEDRTSTFTYNGAGQVRTAKDPLGHTWTYGYALGDLTSVTDPLGRTTNRFVDSAGRVASVTDPLGHLTRRDYDNRNQLLKVTDPLSGQTSFAYDGAGNLTTVTDARGNVTTYTYDNLDRLASKKDALKKVESYAYDANGNITKLTDRKGQVTTYAYDGLNRRTFVGFGTSGNTYSSTIDYTYDAGNRIRQIVDSRGGTITRDFDDLDRPTKEITPNSSTGGIQYSYDDASRRASMTVGSQPAVTYAYNKADQLTGITQGSRSAALGYDAAGRPRTVTLPDGIVETSAYDDASELSGITYTNGATTLGDLSYGYDGSGRRVSVWGTFARTGLPAATASGATYNADNQLTKWNGTTLSHDANGNLTAFGTQTYTWNDRNQLSATSGGAASFSYDGQGRRVSRTVSGTTMKYLYDGVNVVQEQDSANAATANLLTGLGVDQAFSRTDAAGERSFLTDALGSTLALADISGMIVTSYTYEPFGAATSTGAASTNSYQFTGRETDGASGLSFYRARYYSPTVGRFISEDPLGFPGGPDPNVYAYVWNNPVGLVDSFGLDPGPGRGPDGCWLVPNAETTDYLLGWACPPRGFPYQPVRFETPYGRRAGDPKGACSGPVPSYFLPACRTHDYGFDLVKAGVGNKQEVNELFYADMRDLCEAQPWYEEIDCNVDANIAYWVVVLTPATGPPQ